jgi:hypothetical protein
MAYEVHDRMTSMHIGAKISHTGVDEARRYSSHIVASL